MEQKDLDAEYDLTTEYSRKYLRAKIEVKKILDKVSTPQKPLIVDNTGTAQSHEHDSKRRFKLPKIELKKFSGKLKDWLQFWSQFKNIHEDKDINDEDKFQYLIQSINPNSRAAELVNSFPPTSDNYKKVITSLKSRFGKDELLVKVYVRELLKLVLNSAMNPDEKFH